jgi:acyl dehydratase
VLNRKAEAACARTADVARNLNASLMSHLFLAQSLALVSFGTDQCGRGRGRIVVWGFDMAMNRRRRAAKEGADVSEKYLEDFAVGQTYGSGRLTVDKDRIQAFAAEFDPQPFHLDDEAARGSIFGGLAASGWHTAALTMRLLVEGELKPAGGIVGVGFDEFRWPLPVHPGDELHLESEVLEVRPSKSRPNQGLIKVRTTTRNQDGDAVQVLVGNLIVPRRRE